MAYLTIVDFDMMLYQGYIHMTEDKGLNVNQEKKKQCPWLHFIVQAQHAKMLFLFLSVSNDHSGSVSSNRNTMTSFLFRVRNTK